jgi:hypothetical protein
MGRSLGAGSGVQRRIDLQGEAGARNMYESLLQDPGMATKICAEQAVLAKDENAGRADRGVFCTPIKAPGAGW